jgi:ABC-type phosphate/phosphonate transport system substrate-binding protein
MKLRSCLFAILACASASAEDFSMLVLDPLSAKNACACVAGYAQRDYAALAGYLGEALKTPVCPQFGAVLAGQPAIVVGKQTEIEHAAKTAGLRLTRVAALTDRKGSTNLHGLFVVRAKDPAKSLADLKGKRFLFGPAGSDEKHAAALAVLKEAGVPLPAKIEARDTCNQSAADVAENKADAAVISSYAMPLLEGCGTIGKGELRIVGRTADVPFIALYVTSQFPVATLPELQKALDKVAADRPLLDKLESANGFVVVKKK